MLKQYDRLVVRTRSQHGEAMIAEEGSSVSKREPYFDNAKFLLMLLVVFTHLLQPFIKSDGIYHDLYYLIFTFHMPGFALIAGFFASRRWEKDRLIKLVRKCLLPYVFFQWIYGFYYQLIGLEKSFSWSLLVPQWSLWFLLSLFLWQLVLPLWGRMSAEFAIPLSFALSLGAGYITFFGRELALQRTLVFFPFFILGYYLQSGQLKRLRQVKYRFALSLALVACYLFIRQVSTLNKYMFFGSKPYEDFLLQPEMGIAVRALIMGIGLIGLLWFLAFVPTRRYFFTTWGQNTLLVYLLQGFFIQGLRATHLESLELSVLGFFLICVASVALTLFLASPWVAEIYRKIQGRLLWAFTRLVSLAEL